MFPKQKRVVDKELLKFALTLPCMACFKKADHAHHITSRGAGGGDVPNNVVSLCATHHTEIHKIGNKRFSEKYEGFRNWLIAAERFDVLDRMKR